MVSWLVFGQNIVIFDACCFCPSSNACHILNCFIFIWAGALVDGLNGISYFVADSSNILKEECQFPDVFIPYGM